MSSKSFYWSVETRIFRNCGTWGCEWLGCRHYVNVLQTAREISKCGIARGRSNWAIISRSSEVHPSVPRTRTLHVIRWQKGSFNPQRAWCLPYVALRCRTKPILKQFVSGVQILATWMTLLERTRLHQVMKLMMHLDESAERGNARTATASWPRRELQKRCGSRKHRWLFHLC